MNRYEARTLAFELLFQLTYAEPEEQVDLYDKERTERGFEDDPYVREVVQGVSDHLAELDEKIEENSSGWRITRFSRVTLSILRLSTYEMLFREDIPYTVSINEAVELAKKYDDDKAPAFINGILNAIADKAGLKTK